MVNLDPFFFPFTALLLMIVPLQWLGAAFAAAVIHELCHILTILLLGGQIQNIKVGLGKAEIEAKISGNLQEILCAIAGPLGSILLICLRHCFPRIALCGVVQGLFNLLPIYPLDGGRVLYCSFALAVPEYADSIFNHICNCFLCLLIILSILGCIYLKSGPIPILISLHLARNRKKTCKQCRIGIQ